MKTPLEDGFYMPAEFSPHSGTIMIWPERPGSWGKNPEQAEKTFGKIIKEISKHEKVYVSVSEKSFARAKKMLGSSAEIFKIKTDDSWARDTAPTFVVNKKGEIRAVSWQFNAWGGEYDGLYKNYENDNRFAGEISKKLNIDCYDAGDFVLEGGSVHSDGEGTVIVTEACLLSKGRNPQMAKAEIENNLNRFLGAKKIIWLPRGIYNDETNEHVDNVCAFVSPANVVLAWTDDTSDPQYAMSMADYEILQNETDAIGRKINIHKLYVPEHPVLIREQDCAELEFEEGEDTRNPGERLAASYVNFYFANDTIILPIFGKENSTSDKKAVELLSRLCPKRQVVPIDADLIIRGGGNIHCITQQIPFYRRRDI